jgi:sortase A
MRALETILLIVGLSLLGIWGYFALETYLHQAELERSFENLASEPDRRAESVGLPSPGRLSEGDLVGRLEIPRLSMSVMVMEGIGTKTLRLGAGRVPWTAMPETKGNMGIAAHRDTFFRELRNIRENDEIQFTTPGGTARYKVQWTSIVRPEDVHVLKPTKEPTITLVTCYPFYYIGPAPKRFVVRAVKN